MSSVLHCSGAWAVRGRPLVRSEGEGYVFTGSELDPDILKPRKLLRDWLPRTDVGSRVLRTGLLLHRGPRKGSRGAM